MTTTSDNKAKTLTAKQQRNSFAGNKSAKGAKRNIRHVLAKPYINFWPLVDIEVESEVITLLETLLPAARKPITADDRKLLRGMLGKNKKDTRNELTKKIWERNPQASVLRNCLIIGINDVSRSLEDNTLASLLISNEADPPTLTRHLATLAATRNVPHIVLKHLKTTMKKCVDFSSLAVGFKKSVAEEKDNHFHAVHKKIESISKNLAQQMLPDLPKEETISSSAEDLPPVATQVKVQSPTSIYLTRSSRNYRAFTPGKGLQAGPGSSWSQYISLVNSEETNPTLPVTQANKVVLGSTVTPGAKSFLQKVREAKKCLIQPASQKMPSGAFLSLSDNTCDDEGLPAPTAQAPKPSKRYFNSLAPLKVKRMQGNPLKDKSKKKKKKGNV